MFGIVLNRINTFGDFIGAAKSIYSFMVLFTRSRKMVAIDKKFRIGVSSYTFKLSCTLCTIQSVTQLIGGSLSSTYRFILKYP